MHRSTYICVEKGDINELSVENGTLNRNQTFMYMIKEQNLIKLLEMELEFHKRYV